MRYPEIRTAPAVPIALPAEVSRLYDIAYNLWWTWSPQAHLLFSSLDPVRWTRHRNPVEQLLNMDAHRWEPLLSNESFLSAYNAVADAFDRYLEGARDAWFPRTFPEYTGGPIAYFSTEYGWHECLGVYAGGLGVLSGDHTKSASDLALPFVGVGLLYRRGYFRQTVDADGDQQHFYPDHDPLRLPILPVVGPGGSEVRVPVELPGRTVFLRVWKVTVGRVPVLLLDSDVRENDPADRPITSILYVRGREMRLCQEIVLGVGGCRALAAVGIEPAVWHVNEGHSALVALERLRPLLEREGLGLSEAVERISRNAVFTTHTPVPAGNETFESGLVVRYLADWANRTRVPMDSLLALARSTPGEHGGDFNLTALALRTSRYVNGVSRMHRRVVASLWRHLWPDRAEDQLPIGHVTNGVHLPTWIGPEIGEVLARHLGRDFEQRLLDAGFEEAVLAIPDEELWSAHEAQKRRLILLTRERLLHQLARHGQPPGELREVSTLLDPSALTLGFARRFATYKRASLIFHDPAQLRSILSEPGRPVQIVFAGKAHPADDPGQDLIRRIFQLSRSADFRGRIVYLEDYDMRIARFLVQGADAWLNTPRRPMEASGTSGMKAAVNGCLNVSIFDGWWCEGYDPSHGWVVGPRIESVEPSGSDEEDARDLYRVIREEIVPCYYRRDPSGLPTEWIRRMKHAIGKLAPRFSAWRMVREYAVKAYLPAIRQTSAGLSEREEARLWSP
jgi:starch phosphorylase